MNIIPKKEDAIKAATWLAPIYFDLYNDLRLTNSGLALQTEIQNIRSNLSFYVSLYDDEKKIGRALFYALMGKDGCDEYFKNLSLSSIEDQQNEIDELIRLTPENIEELTARFQIPQTPEEWDKSRKLFEQLEEDDRKDCTFRGRSFWCFTFCSLFNLLSLMIHGTKLTSLVKMAISGDDLAFFKAIQIDKQLLISHPFFIEKKRKAQQEQNKRFLSNLSYSENKPTFNTKVRFPALYMLFGILESFQWLDRLKHKEILDICEIAQLHKHQNRIEDVTYISKRLKDYRYWQRSNQKSMP